jgi:hypothetical protein
MILSSGKIFKSFADQRCFSFECDLSLSSTSGNTSIGATRTAGPTETVLFNFQSGKILDSTNNFIYSYSANENIKISGNVCSGLFGYYINDQPIRPRNRLCSACFTTTTLENFFISTSGAEVDFSLNINIDVKPSFSINFPFSPYITGSNISGYLSNTSPIFWQSIKVFSGNSVFFDNSAYKINQQLTGVKIAPGSSGLFLVNYDGSDNRFSIDESGNVSDLSGVLYLDTNFGRVEENVSIPLFKSPNYSVDFSAGFTGANSFTGFLWSHILSRQACSGISYQIIAKKGFWVDSVPMSSLVKVETGQFLNGRILTGVEIFFDSVSDQYRATGFLPSSGCFDSSSFEIDHSVYYNFINEQNKNEIILSVSGINEPFYFERIF